MVESCLDLLKNDVSRIDELSQSCCEANDSRLDILESEIDEISFSLPDDLSSRLDALESCCEENREDILELESCCEANDSRIDILESKVDALEMSQTDVVVTATCEVRVCEDLNFTLDMLPKAGETKIFKFDPCCVGACLKDNAPKVIFDPAIYGNGGRVELPQASRLEFCGFGMVELKDGVIFEYTGTPCGDVAPQADWPELLLVDTACLTVEEGGTATIGGGTSGAGCFNLRGGAAIDMYQDNSHLIFGENELNEIIVNAEYASHISVNNPSALISYQLGVFDLLFDNNSSMEINMGAIELNTLECQQAAGKIRRWEFTNDSCLVLPGQCGKTLGLLRIANNRTDHPCDDGENVEFNNLAGHVCGHGDLQYVAFDEMGNKIVSSTTQIQNNMVCFDDQMLEVFFNLSYILTDQLNETPDSLILALQGSRPNQSQCGRLVAFCPDRDGRFVGLAQGDHDLFYNMSTPCGPEDLICGFDRLGRQFCISNCDENTRVPAAPPVTP